MATDGIFRTTGMVFTEGPLSDTAVLNKAELRAAGSIPFGSGAGESGSLYNTNAIYADGISFTTGFDASGNAYSGTLLGPTVTYSSVPFTYGLVTQLNSVSNKTVYLPPGEFKTLSILGSANTAGNQVSQSFVVNYFDGTSTTFSQTINSWTNSAGSGSAVGIFTYRNKSNGTKDNTTNYIFKSDFTLDTTKFVTSLTLPTNVAVKILGITLTTSSGPGFIQIINNYPNSQGLSAQALQNQKSLRETVYSPIA